jgi:hypothetical protein
VERTLSAPSTPLLKFVLPPVWTAIFGYGTFQLWTNPAEVVYNGVRGAATPATQWLFLGAFVVGVLYLAWWCLPLKQVVLAGNSLRISNFRSEVVVPLEAVERVTQSRLLGRLVTLRLRTDTAFGDRITFLPNTRPGLLFWREDELMGELRELAGIKPAGPHRSSAA